jgi:glutamyl-tRNA reductase
VNSSTLSQLFLEIYVTGVSFSTLSIENREKLSLFARPESHLALMCDLTSSVVISTCNRFEVVTTSSEDLGKIVDFFRDQCPWLPQKTVFQLQGRDAVRHLFRLTSSLDSMVVGETQIAGQVKDAYLFAVQEGRGSKLLHHLFQFSFSLSKKIKRSTGLGAQGLSISYVAVQLAQKIFDNFAKVRTLLIGSGQMAELCLLNLKAKGCRSIIIANRTIERGRQLADRVNGEAIRLDEIAERLDDIDLIVGSIQIDAPIITKAHLKHRSGGPLFLIDLGVPRNFSPQIADLDDVFLYDIDHLGEFIARNKVVRNEAALDAELIIEYGLRHFEQWIERLRWQPETIRVRTLIRKVVQEEVQQVLQKEAIALDADRLEHLIHRISQKVNHGLMEGLNAGQQSGSSPHVTSEVLLGLYFDELLDINT